MKYLFCLPLLFLTGRHLLAQKIDYAEVAKIFQAKCATCHRPGEAAPFALVSYDDIAKRATFIKKVVESGYMPPWKADVHYRDFANDRSLTPEERERIVRWIDAGAEKGKGSVASAKLLNGTAYGRPPDLTLRIDSSYKVQGDNEERFIVSKLPYELPEGVDMEAVEFVCNNKKIIHHANYGFYEVADTSVTIFGGSRFLDGDLAGPAMDEYNHFKKNFVFYTGWIPGSSYESYASGMGWKLPRRGVVLLTVHYSAIAVDESSIVGVNLFFANKPVRRQVKVISLGTGGIGEDAISPPLWILAGQVQAFHLKVQTQEDQSLLYIWPHMHYIGKEFTAFAVTPAGDTIPLVHIPRWDFRWQELYRMKKLLKIPAGSIVNVIGVYDNTADNPANPNSPPKMIVSTGNMRAKNEMLTLVLIYVSSEDGDEKISLE